MDKITARYVNPRIERALASPHMGDADRALAVKIINGGGYTHEDGLTLWSIVAKVERAQ